jgi:hypothetical protein
MLTRESLLIGAQILWINLKLVRENEVPEFVAQLFRARVEVARHYGRLVRPIVHGQGKVMTHQGNFVGLRSLLENWRDAAALRALEVLENHECNLRPLRRTEHLIYWIIRRAVQSSGAH